MTINLVFEGENHPKTVFVVTDDADAERAQLIDLANEVDDDELAEAFSNAKVDDEGNTKTEIPFEFVDVLEGEWPHLADQLDDQRREAARAAGIEL